MLDPTSMMPQPEMTVSRRTILASVPLTAAIKAAQVVTVVDLPPAPPVVPAPYPMSVPALIQMLVF